jgi:S-DNA-T family DNA segregation ATPase FtsK/SpoIIIE
MPPTDIQFATIAAITIKLAQLGLEVSFQEPITTGPLITTYRFLPRCAAKVSQITSCSADLAIALSAEDVLVRRLPGEGVIGVSVPNKERKLVLWRDTLAQPFNSMLIPLNLGVDAEGRLYRDDLAKTPHLLVAGTTGSGKSTCIVSMLASLMYWRSSDQVQFVLSDTKNVEFGHFIGAPHLLFEPATTMYQTWERMDWLIDEMDRRLQIIGRAGCRNIVEYSALSPPAHFHTMPYIVLVIDELCDVLGGQQRGEGKIADSKLGRIVQKSRAAGVHVLASTQRPSVNIVTGSIKANFPGRLTFRLPSEADSRTVIGCSGAEHLLTRGDMLYSGPASASLTRLHSAYTDINDIKQCVSIAKMKSQIQQQETKQCDTSTTQKSKPS